MGIIILMEEDYARAYGEDVKGLGAGFLAIAAITPFSTWVGAQGAKHHNKFLLMVHATVDLALFITHLTLALTLVGLTETEYASGVRADCMKNAPEGDSSVCAAYQASARYAGMKLVWLARYELAMSDSSTLAELEGWESGGKCCGFGPPKSCTEDFSPFPSYLSTVDVPAKYTSQVTTCGYRTNWYPVVGKDANICRQYVNPNAANLVIGGCQYENPGPSCRDEDIDDDTAGCAAYVQDQLDSELSLLGGILAMMSALEALAVLLACCYCWKRKHHDVLPAYLDKVSDKPYDNVKAVNSHSGNQKGAFELVSASAEGYEETKEGGP